MHKISTIQTEIIIRLIAVFVIGGVLICQLVSGTEPRNYPKIGQWKPAREIPSYTPENLFDYINGASELYLAYDFQQLDVVYYKNRKKQEITVEVYTHASPLCAFGIYSQERSADGQYLDLGAESYISGNYLFCLTGNHYIKLYSYDLTDEVESVLTGITKTLIDFLQSENVMPRELSLFPDKNRVPYSIQFIAKNMLGYSFFRSGFQADYQLNGQKCRVFFIKSESIKATNDLFDQYLNYIRHLPRIPGSNEYKITDPYHGEGVIRKYKHYVFGGFGSADIATVLDQLQAQITNKY